MGKAPDWGLIPRAKSPLACLGGPPTICRRVWQFLEDSHEGENLKLFGSSVVAVAVAVAGCTGKGGTAVADSGNCADIARGPAVSPATVTLNVGDTVRFSATMPPTCAPGANPVLFRWSSADASRMTVDSLTGLGTALDAGTVAIIATLTSDSTVRGASTVTIHP